MYPQKIMFCKTNLSVAIFFPSFQPILPQDREEVKRLSLKNAANGKFTVKQFFHYFHTN